MGYGEFLGGGSVVWTVDQEGHVGPVNHPGGGNKVSNATSNKPQSDLGVDKGAPPGHFRVDIRFAAHLEAKAYLDSAQVFGSSLVLFVPADALPGSSAANPKPQIKVSW